MRLLALCLSAVVATTAIGRDMQPREGVILDGSIPDTGPALDSDAGERLDRAVDRLVECLNNHHECEPADAGPEFQ